MATTKNADSADFFILNDLSKSNSLLIATTQSYQRS